MDHLRKRLTDEWPTSADATDESLFDHALQLPPEEREAFLEAACGTDECRRRELISLIAAHESAGEFLENPVVLCAAHLVDEVDEMEGATLGNYRILERIGVGGMGAVYLAARADRAFERKVALKLIKRGMDTDEILQRFRRERALLATLDHRNVARLLDAGAAPDGRPYLVMEHVEGLRIDAFCAQHDLSIRERLLLFWATCEAVQHAHQRLIVHRDLKPSNILVTQSKSVKVIDFGIARLLSDNDTEATQTGARFLTPRYSSPEQLRGDRVNTSADVYALGVILYELLTGIHPYANAEGALPGSREELEAAVTAGDPPRPSQQVLRNKLNPSRQRWARGLVGDLDTIILTAIHRDPIRRYQSVEQLHEDIRRHLTGLPVRARPDTFGYRAGKFLRRNRLGASVTAAFLVVLLGSASLITQFWLQASEQRNLATMAEQRATRRFDEVRSLAHVLMFDLHDEIEHLAGSTNARHLLIDTALEYLDALSAEAGDDMALLSELAAGYDRMGRIQGLPTTASLGDPASGHGSFGQAERLLEKLFELAQREEPVSTGDSPWRTEIGRIEHRLFSCRLNKARMLSELGRLDEALALLTQLVGDAERLAARDPDSYVYVRARYLALIFLGNQVLSMGDIERAAAVYQEASQAAEALAARWPELDEPVRDVRVALSKLSDVQLRLHRLEEAAASRERYLPALRELVEREPTNGQHVRDLATTYMNLGRIAHAQDDLPGALGWYDEAEHMLARLVELDASDATARRTLSILYENMAEAQESHGEIGRALEGYRKSYALSVALAEETPSNVSHQVSLSWCGINVARMLLAADRVEEAWELVDRSIAVISPVAADAPALSFPRTVLARGHDEATRCLLRLGRADEAWVHASAFYEVVEAQHEERPSDPGIRAVLARATFGLAAAGCEVGAAGEPVSTGDSPWRGLPVRPAGWISRTSESLAWLREHRWGRAEEALARELDELMERCGK